MKKLVVPFLALGFAGALFAAPSVEASDTGKPAAKTAMHSRPCRKVTVAAMSKTVPAASSAGDASFTSDYYNQHPSGGG